MEKFWQIKNCKILYNYTIFNTNAHHDTYIQIGIGDFWMSKHLEFKVSKSSNNSNQVNDKNSFSSSNGSNMSKMVLAGFRDFLDLRFLKAEKFIITYLMYVGTYLLYTYLDALHF